MENIIDFNVSIINDTEYYAVRLGRRFGFCTTREEAEEIIHNACPGHIDDSGFGLVGIYKPGGKDPVFGSNKNWRPLSELRPIDIRGYAERHVKRFSRRIANIDTLEGPSALPVRFASYRVRKALDRGDMEVAFFTGMWKLEEAQQEWLAAVPNADLNQYRFEERFSSLDEFHPGTKRKLPV